MSIHSNSRVDRPGLDQVNGRVGLDDLRGREQPRSSEAEFAELAYADASQGQNVGTTDAGEDVLNASAWDGVPDGDRLLQGDSGFENALGALELSQAADAGTDAVLAVFG